MGTQSPTMNPTTECPALLVTVNKVMNGFAHSDAYDGLYSADGWLNGRPSWDVPQISADKNIIYDGSQWVINGENTDSYLHHASVEHIAEINDPWAYSEDNSAVSVNIKCVLTGSPTAAPTSSPTAAPSGNPTLSPSAIPTFSPSAAPSFSPTTDPTSDPTFDPSIDPTNDPTIDPTSDHSSDPTSDPTEDPTLDPTNDPTTEPTMEPSVDPTLNPTLDPTFDPTVDPTIIPTNDPVEIQTIDIDAGNGGNSGAGAAGAAGAAETEEDDLPILWIIIAAVIALIIIGAVTAYFLRKRWIQKQRKKFNESVINMSMRNLEMESEANPTSPSCNSPVSQTADPSKVDSIMFDVFDLSQNGGGGTTPLPPMFPTRDKPKNKKISTRKSMQTILDKFKGKTTLSMANSDQFASQMGAGTVTPKPMGNTLTVPQTPSEPASARPSELMNNAFGDLNDIAEENGQDVDDEDGMDDFFSYMMENDDEM